MSIASSANRILVTPPPLIATSAEGALGSAAIEISFVRIGPSADMAMRDPNTVGERGSKDPKGAMRDVVARRDHCEAESKRTATCATGGRDRKNGNVRACAA